ncbi:MAG: protein kinase [Labilithrix sp.]|nr:protein kinase [Labilithrix sp.]MCW5812183.1 protein kinase [Labilithrix sp.]
MLNQAVDPFGIIGQVLDSQFRVDRLVGEGGFSAVYRGYHLGLDEPIAVKCLKLPPTLQPQLVEQFERRFRDESRILYRLSQGNLNIVRSIAGGTWQSPMGALVPFMVLEWMEGRSLANELTIRRTVGKQGRPLGEVMKVFASAADGLGYAHAQGVIHRDLNPGNFFFANTPQGQRLKILDFGVAKILDDSSLNIERNQTVGQIRIFAPAYGAPEQFDDSIGKTSAASDVYSFALILMESLRDRAVNDGTHLGEFAQRAIDPRTRPTPRSLGIEVEDEIELIFARATKVKPNERWQSASEFWNALEHATSAASEERHAQAALETPSLGMPMTGARSTKTGMAPPAQRQGKSPGMKRMDKTVPVGAVMPNVPQKPRGIPPSAPRIEAPAPAAPPSEPPGADAGYDEATRIGASPTGGALPVLADENEGDEVTRVGAPAAEVLRGLADVELRGGAGAVTMTKVSQGNQNNRPAAGHPPSGEHPQAQPYPQQPAPPPPPQQQARAPQAMAGTLMMAPGQGGFGPLPPPPQQAGRPPPQQMQQPPPQQMQQQPPPMQQSPSQQMQASPPQMQQPPPQQMQQPPQQMQQPPPQQMQQPPPQMQPPMQQPPMQPMQQPGGYGQQPPQQQQPYGQQPAMAADASLAPAGVPKKSSAGLIIGIIFGLLVLGGVGAALVVVGLGSKAPTVASASASGVPVEVPPIPATAEPPPTAEPDETPPPPAEEDAGAVAEVEVDAGAQAANTDPAPDPNNGAAVAQPANPNPGQPWTPPPAQPTPTPAVKDAGPPADPNAFNEGTARSRLAQANGVLVFCKKEGGVTGPGTATVTFAPDGSVTSVAIDAPYAGTPTGDCVAGQFKRQKTTPWQGSPQSVKHSFEVPK